MNFHDLCEFSMTCDKQLFPKNCKKQSFILSIFPHYDTLNVCCASVSVFLVFFKFVSYFFNFWYFYPFFSESTCMAFLWLCMTHTSISRISRPGKWNYKIPNFPGVPWPVWTVQFAVYHTLSGWVRNSFFSLSKFPCPASLIIIDPMSVELLMRRWSNNELSDWSTYRENKTWKSKNKLSIIKSQ